MLAFARSKLPSGTAAQDNELVNCSRKYCAFARSCNRDESGLERSSVRTNSGVAAPDSTALHRPVYGRSKNVLRLFAKRKCGRGLETVSCFYCSCLLL